MSRRSNGKGENGNKCWDSVDRSRPLGNWNLLPLPSWDPPDSTIPQWSFSTRLGPEFTYLIACILWCEEACLSISKWFSITILKFADVPEQSHTSVNIDRVEVYPRTSGGNMPEIKSNRMHTAALEHQSNRDRVDVAAVDGKIVRVPSIQCFPSKVRPPVHCITPLKNCRTGLAVGICSLQ